VALGPGVVATTAGDRAQADPQAVQEILDHGTGRRIGTGSVVVRGARRTAVLASGAAVGGGRAVGVQGGHAPAGARMPGRGGYQVPRRLGVDQAETGHLRWLVGLALGRPERHGDRHQRREARAVVLARVATRAGPGWAVVRAAVPAGRVAVIRAGSRAALPAGRVAIMRAGSRAAAPAAVVAVIRAAA
jgi:hypothetical protein